MENAPYLREDATSRDMGRMYLPYELYWTVMRTFVVCRVCSVVSCEQSEWLGHVPLPRPSQPFHCFTLQNEVGFRLCLMRSTSNRRVQLAAGLGQQRGMTFLFSDFLLNRIDIKHMCKWRFWFAGMKCMERLYFHGLDDWSLPNQRSMVWCDWRQL